MTDSETHKGATTKAEVETSSWEWVVAALGALIVLGAVGYVFYKAVVEPTTPPRFEFAVEEVHALPDGGYLVEFWTYNRGTRTAKDLTIEGQLVDQAGVKSTRSVGFTFVPGESKRKGGLYFPVNPARYRIHLYPIGYDVP